MMERVMAKLLCKVVYTAQHQRNKLKRICKGHMPIQTQSTSLLFVRCGIFLSSSFHSTNIECFYRWLLYFDSIFLKGSHYLDHAEQVVCMFFIIIKEAFVPRKMQKRGIEDVFLYEPFPSPLLLPSSDYLALSAEQIPIIGVL